MWWDYDVGWVGWLAMILGMATFWIVLAVVVIALLRGVWTDRGRRPDARELLRERLARGEIEIEEYEQRLEALSRTGH